MQGSFELQQASSGRSAEYCHTWAPDTLAMSVWPLCMAEGASDAPRSISYAYS